MTTLSEGPADRASPLAAVLGIRPGVRAWVGGSDVAAKNELAGLLVGAQRPPTGPIELGVVCAKGLEEAEYFLRKLSPRLGAGAGVVVTLPREVETGQASPVERLSKAAAVESKSDRSLASGRRLFHLMRRAD